MDKVGQAAVRNFSRDNRVDHNRISDFMQILSDGGGIYTQGVTGPSLAHGERVVGNVVHDQLTWGRALLSDDGAEFITYAGNVRYNDTYDYCCISHFNYRQDRRVRRQQYFAQTVRGNFWQQEDPDFSGHGVTETRNTLITGPEQVAADALTGAGIEAPFRSTLAWRYAGESVPNPPSRVSVLYAFDGRAYVTWRPSYAAGNSPVAAYTVTACRAGGSMEIHRCERSTKVAAKAFIRTGYAVVRGLSTGAEYSIIVTAASSRASSTPSIPSLPATVSTHAPGLPGRPTRVQVRAGHHEVALSWYAPASAQTNPVLRYLVVSSSHQRVTAVGLRQLIVANANGKALLVLGHLQARHATRFSISAVTPAGVGAAASSPPLTPE